MRKLEHYLDIFLEDHLAFLKPRLLATQDHTLTSAIIRLKAIGTVRFDSGRQTGKSSYIARSACSRDIIFCVNTNAVTEMEQRRSMYNGSGSGPKVYSINDGVITDGPVDDVWIDDACYLKDYQLENLYKTLADRCRRFILIG